MKFRPSRVSEGTLRCKPLSMKKYLLVICILFSIIGCEQPSPNNKTELVQACLNKLQVTDLNYLERSDLILVKNNYSSDLDSLHFGKKQIILMDVAPSAIKIYTS